MIYIRIRPIDNDIKNSYDSILKIATHYFVNALIPITDLPEDEYRIVSCEIFKPGKDVKSMDILLKGKKGCVNIEFHKQALSKSQLDRDFEYVVECYLFYDKTIDQRIVVLDNKRKSIEKLQIMPDLEYKAKYHSIQEIDGATTLNNIKNKIKNNLELDDYEQYVFSILPLTNHGHDNEEQLVKELCYLNKKLNISEKNREAIALCQLIQIELFVNDEELENELMDVIAMTSSCIERRENKLKNTAKKAQEKANKTEIKLKQTQEKAKQAEIKLKQTQEKAKQAEIKLKQTQEKANKTEIKLKQTQEKVKQEKQNTKNILKEITQNIDENGKLNPKTLQKILTITKEM